MSRRDSRALHRASHMDAATEDVTRHAQNTNLTISIFADVSIRSLPTIKFSAAAGVVARFAAGEFVGAGGALAAFVSAAISRGGPFSFSFRTCNSRMIKNCWFAPAI